MTAAVIQDATPLILQRMPLSCGHAVLRIIHVSIDDMVFTTDAHTRVTVVAVGRRKLSSWDLHKKVRSWVCLFTPFPSDMVQTEIQFVARKQLQKVLAGVPNERTYNAPFPHWFSKPTYGKYGV